MYLGYKGKKASNNFDNAILFLVFILLHFFSLKTLYQLCEDEEQTLIIIQTSNGEVRTKQSYTVISVLIFSPVFFTRYFIALLYLVLNAKLPKQRLSFLLPTQKDYFKIQRIRENSLQREKSLWCSRYFIACDFTFLHFVLSCQFRTGLVKFSRAIAIT